MFVNGGGVVGDVRYWHVGAAGERRGRAVEVALGAPAEAAFGARRSVDAVDALGKHPDFGGVELGSVGMIARDHRARVARKLLGVLAHKGRRGREDEAVAADRRRGLERGEMRGGGDRKSTRLNSSH